MEMQARLRARRNLNFRTERGGGQLGTFRVRTRRVSLPVYELFLPADRVFLTLTACFGNGARLCRGRHSRVPGHLRYAVTGWSAAKELRAGPTFNSVRAMQFS